MSRFFLLSQDKLTVESLLLHPNVLRCQTSPSLWTLGRNQPVIPRVTFIRWSSALLRGTVGSLEPTFVSARHVRLAVRLACALALYARFPSALSQPSYASVTFWEASAPDKLPACHCSFGGFTPGG